ncbi:solute carrier family 15 member 5 [Xenopus laevis]|uniref:Solute carrier family 15 member 5 n=3 Tax=Xenopus laevis TaxID=8355 RepID=A0A1L8GVV5_XENLA|nr:solute carrier family 15 member 5 [Xenopus laevis]OCT87950.1 hypothetical protein XELAEV_18016579mg [Xenopus laevis]
MPLLDTRSFPAQQHWEPSFDGESARFSIEDPYQGSSAPHVRRKLHVVICRLLVELCERFTFFGTVCNMILFCTIKLSYRNHEAAIVNLCFVGISTLSPVLIGWMCENCTQRSRVIYTCAFLHFVGTALLPVVAFPFEDFYIDVHHIAHTLAKREQSLLFYTGLLMAAIGTGGIRAIICPLSAYSLQGYDWRKFMSFFNWFYWLVNLNSLVVFMGISYIQQSVAKNLGFLIPFMSVVMALITIHMVRNDLLYQPRKGGSLLVTLGVFTNAVRMCCTNYHHLGGRVNMWLDCAKENNGGWYSESHVENTKALVRLFPLFSFQLLYRICIMQTSSGYFIQTMNSNLNFYGFLLPIAAMTIISIIPQLILAPCFEGLNSRFFSKLGYGLTPSSYIICGHLCAAVSLLVAGIYELHRNSFPLVEQTLSGTVLLVSSMPCYQLAPQYVLLGIAEALVLPCCSVITVRLVPGQLRGIAMHFLSLFNAAGCFMGALVAGVAFLASEGNWYPAFLPMGHLERFYFFLGTLGLLNTLCFWKISHRYNDLDQEMELGFRRSRLEEKLIQHERSLKFYESVLDWTYPFSPMETAV